MTTPCAGQSAIFDATDAHSHAIARALCATCPAIAWCAGELKKAPLPQGTWAGRLIDGRHRKSYPHNARIEAEEAMFTDEDARLAHAAWQRGERDDDRNRIGERVYQRRRHQRRIGAAA